MSVIGHGTDIRDAIKVVIRKDEWVPSKPWFADIHFPDGHVWRGWAEFMPSRKSVLDHINSVCPNAKVEG